MKPYRSLDLFSGIGGFSLGLERTGGFETVAFCEIDKFPRQVLKQHWPDVPIYEDVKDVTARRLAADGIFPNIVTGGFPCQDISVAGNQKGIGAARSGLWAELARIIDEVRPDYAIVENVTALISGERGTWFGTVLGDLAQIGYDCQWHCISASQLGAYHHRDRVWIICYPQHPGRSAAKVGTVVGQREEESTGQEPTRQSARSGSGESATVLGNTQGNKRDGNEADTQTGSAGVRESGRTGGRNNIPNTHSESGRNEREEEEPGNGEVGGGQAKSDNDGAAGNVPNPNSTGCQSNEALEGGSPEQFDCSGFQPRKDFPNSHSERLQRGLQHQIAYQEGWEIKSIGCTVECSDRWERHRNGIWQSEPPIRGMVDGVSDGLYLGRTSITQPQKEGEPKMMGRAHRLKGLGNAVVPQIPEMIGNAILELDFMK